MKYVEKSSLRDPDRTVLDFGLNQLLQLKGFTTVIVTEASVSVIVYQQQEMKNMDLIHANGSVGLRK